MSEPTGPGMGRPSGPEFTGPSLSDAPPGVTSQSGRSPHAAAVNRDLPGGPDHPGGRRPPVPPPNRLPAVLTILAIAVVAAVVAVASVLAARDDIRSATPRPIPTRVAASPIPTDRIEFSTDSGSGVLEIVDHAWDSDGTDLNAPGTLLTVAVKVTCKSGVLRYGPDFFQAFDRSGDLFDAEVLPESTTALEFGTLSAGQQVSGTVAFDIPRGAVTLLMSDENSRTVTALKVPD